MRKELKKAIRDCFDERVAKTLPQFKPLEHKHPTGNTRLYVWEPAPDLSLYIRLLPSGKVERFTIEIGWSTDHRYPENAPTTSDPDALPTGLGVCFRMSRLWQRQASEKWWELS